MCYVFSVSIFLFPASGWQVCVAWQRRSLGVWWAMCTAPCFVQFLEAFVSVSSVGPTVVHGAHETCIIVNNL